MRPLRAIAAAALACAAPGMIQPAAAELRITYNGEAAAPDRELTLGVGKAAVIDLPADARDVLISNPAVADAVVRSARRVFIIGRGVGSADAFFFDAQGRRIAAIDLRVEPDLSGLNRLLNTVSGGKVRAAGMNMSVAITGAVANTAEADRIMRIATAYLNGAAAQGSAPAAGGVEVVNLLTVNSEDQVLVKVRIVEMSRDLRRRLGVQINDTSDLLTSVLPDELLLGLGTNFNITGTGEGLNARVRLRGDNGAPDLDATLQAFESAGLARVLAEPNLTAVSGEAARFLSGGEFPAFVGFDDDGREIFEYRPFGVSLAVTPVVLSSGRISLKLSTEVSARAGESTSGFGEDLEVRRAETTVEMGSGSSLVIAGLIQDNAVEEVTGAPGFMRLPGFGALFRTRSTEAEQRELVVIVTPYMVRPTSPDALRTPMDGVRAAGWTQMTFLDRLNETYRTPASAPPPGPMRGPVGFVLPEAPTPQGGAAP